MSVNVINPDIDCSVELNMRTAFNSHEWVFADERIRRPLRDFDIPKSKVVSLVNGIPVYQGENTWNVLRPEWKLMYDKLVHNGWAKD